MPYRLARPRRSVAVEVSRHLVDDAQALVAPFSSLGSFRPFASTEFETRPARPRQNQRIDEVAAGGRSSVRACRRRECTRAQTGDQRCASGVGGDQRIGFHSRAAGLALEKPDRLGRP
jgi:hypothetical protein